MDFSPTESQNVIFAHIRFIPKLERVHPERGGFPNVYCIYDNGKLLMSSAGCRSHLDPVRRRVDDRSHAQHDAVTTGSRRRQQPRRQ